MARKRTSALGASITAVPVAASRARWPARCRRPGPSDSRFRCAITSGGIDAMMSRCVIGLPFAMAPTKQRSSPASRLPAAAQITKDSNSFYTKTMTAAPRLLTALPQIWRKACGSGGRLPFRRLLMLRTVLAGVVLALLQTTELSSAGAQPDLVENFETGDLNPHLWSKARLPGERAWIHQGDAREGASSL